MSVTSACIDRRHKSAEFRETRSLDNFDFSFNPSINRAQIYELATGHFVVSAGTCSWSARRGSAKVISSRPSAGKYSRPASWSFTARSSIWCASY